MKKALIALLVAVVVAIVCVLLGKLLLKIEDVELAVSIGEFLDGNATLIGILGGIVYFIWGGNLLSE